MRYRFWIQAGMLTTAMALGAGRASAADAGVVKPEEIKGEEAKVELVKPAVREAVAKGASPLEQVISEGRTGVAFNDAVLILIRESGAQITLMPELSDPVLLKKPVDVQSGVALRTALDHLCGQVSAKWETADEGKTIVLSPASGLVTLVEKAADPLKSKISVSCSGAPLLNLAAEIRMRTGLGVAVPEALQKLQIEIAVEGWELERVLNSLCFHYDLEMTKTKDGVSLSKKE